VVSWNLNAGRGDLPALVDDLAAGRLSGAVPLDYVLLLQEVMDRPGADAPLARIAGRGLGSFFVPVIDTADGTRGNAIVSTLPLEDPHVIPLPRERQSRSAAAGWIRLRGERLLLVSVHLENRLSWRRGGLFSENARGRQAAALVSAIPPDAHGILGGDLNTWLGPTEPAWRTLLARFTDTPRQRRPAPTFRERLTLDHLFFDLPGDWRATWRVLHEKFGSDHQPVLGQLVVEP
jgi:endonuclease/exonuclease/phosphatase family metal-dependent hydrolase